MAPIEASVRHNTSPLLEHTNTYATTARRNTESLSTASTLSPSCLQENTCTLLPKTHISLPRTAFILSLTLLLALTLTSAIALGLLLYRHRARRRQSQEAKSWGRKSRYLNRISLARKQLDDEFRHRYHGVLVNEVENPEMGSDSPVELGWEERVWELPNVQVKREKKLPPLPPVPEIPESVRVREGLGGVGGGGGGFGGGGVGRKSLFFCDGVGVWMPKR